MISPMIDDDPDNGHSTVAKGVYLPMIVLDTGIGTLVCRHDCRHDEPYMEPYWYLSTFAAVYDLYVVYL